MNDKFSHDDLWRCWACVVDIALIVGAMVVALTLTYLIGVAAVALVGAPP